MKNIIRFLIVSITTLCTFYSCTIKQPTEAEYYIESYQFDVSTPGATGLIDSLLYGGINTAGLTGFINSIVILKDNKLVSTNYFNGTGPNSVWDVKSVTKSYVSAFTGIAIDKGLITLDSKLTDFFPDLKNRVIDQRINNITVRHLLTMTSGLKSDAVVYPDLAINDWTEYILSYTLDNDPGTFYRYSDSGAYLMSALLTKAAGQNTFEFAKTNFFNPLNFILQGWARTTTGVPIGGSTMMFTPKNMAVLGLLYLNKGKLNGKQIVSENWVAASTIDHVNWSNEEWGPVKKLGYGYFWWTGEMNGRKIYMAVGYAGQFIFCVPDANMVIAICTDSMVYTATANDQAERVLNLISQYFIPAIK